MANSSFNYSKWDNIELSDDESDLHPNIDKESWFRLKHRTRLEREEREDQEVRAIQEKNKVDQARISIIQARLSSLASNEEDEDAQFEDTDALAVELKELQANIAAREKRVKEIQSKREWNIDNICRVKEEKTVVNELQSKPLKADINEEINDATSPTSQAIAEYETMKNLPSTAAAITSSSSSSSAAVATPPLPPVEKKMNNDSGSEPASTIKRERMAVISYNDYCIKHEKILEEYSVIYDFESTKDFLFKHCDILLHEHAQSYILLSCLEDEMNGKHDRMKIVCRQSQILSHIHELGVSMKRDPRDVIIPFFKRIAEPEYMKNFLSAVQDFMVKIQKRAVEKRKEMDAERYAEEQGGAPALGPGGLDPMEVLEQLPAPMRKAFESQDIGRLQAVLGKMDPTEAKFWMRKCVDSGLWVAKDSSIFEDTEDGGEEGEEEGEQEEGSK